MLSGMSLEKYFFGPLDKKHCNFFYFFTVLMFISLAMGIVGLLMRLLKGGRKGLSSTELILVVYNLLLTFVSYFTYRLLYSMCMGNTEGFEDKKSCEDANGQPIDCPVEGFVHYSSTGGLLGCQKGSKISPADG